MKYKVGDRVKVKSMAQGIDGHAGTIVHVAEYYFSYPYVVQMDDDYLNIDLDIPKVHGILLLEHEIELVENNVSNSILDVINTFK